MFNISSPNKWIKRLLKQLITIRCNTAIYYISCLYYIAGDLLFINAWRIQHFIAEMTLLKQRVSRGIMMYPTGCYKQTISISFRDSSIRQWIHENQYGDDNLLEDGRTCQYSEASYSGLYWTLFSVTVLVTRLHWLRCCLTPVLPKITT